MTRNTIGGRGGRIACFFAALPLLSLFSASAISAAATGAPAPPAGSYRVYVGYADALRPSPANFPVPWAGNPHVVYVGCNPNACGVMRRSNPHGIDGGAIEVVNTSSAAETVNQVNVIFGGGVGHQCFNPLLRSTQIILPGESLITNEAVGGPGARCKRPAGTMDSSDIGIDGIGWSKICKQSGMVPQIQITVDNVATDYTDTDQVLITGGFDLADCAIPGGVVNESQQWVPIGQPPGCGAAVLSLTPLTQTLRAPRGAKVVAHLSHCGSPLVNATVHLLFLQGPNSGYGASTRPVLTDANGNATFTYAYRGGGPGAADILQAITTTFAGTIYSNEAIVNWTNTRTPALQLSVEPTSPLSPRRSGGPEVYEVTLTGNHGTPRGKVFVNDGLGGNCALTFNTGAGASVSKKCPPITESTANSPYQVTATFEPANGSHYPRVQQTIVVTGQATNSNGAASTTVTNPNGSGSVTVTGSGNPHSGGVTASQYGTNPTHGISDGTNYFDASVTSGFTQVVIQDCEEVTTATTLQWWNATARKWDPVIGNPTTFVPGAPPCLDVTINGTSSPTITQLQGTIFASMLARTITSSQEETGFARRPFSFTVTTSGTPTARLTETGALLPGLKFVDNGDGTATISGTMPPTAQVATITVKATFGSAGSQTQRLTLAAVAAGGGGEHLDAKISGGGTFTASAKTTVLTDGKVSVTCITKPKKPASSAAGTIPSGTRKGDVPVKVGAITKLAFSNCTGPAGAVTTTVKAEPYFVAIDSKTDSQGETDGLIGGIKIAVKAAGCSFTVTGSASGFYTNGKHTLTMTPKLPVKVTTTTQLTVSGVVGCAGMVQNGDHPTFRSVFTLNRNVVMHAS